MTGVFGLFDLLKGSGRQSDGTKRARDFSVDHQFEIDVIVRQIREIRLLEFGREFLREDFGIRRADAENDERSDVAQDGIFDIRLKLRQILMREN